nr:hypothetical protein [Tanacetum cinerariifolium]
MVTIQPIQGRQNHMSAGSSRSLHQDQEEHLEDKGMVQGQSTSSSSSSQWTGFARRGVGLSSRSRNGRAYQADDLDAYDLDCDELNS